LPPTASSVIASSEMHLGALMPAVKTGSWHESPDTVKHVRRLETESQTFYSGGWRFR
jgi:hypothetical protein